MEVETYSSDSKLMKLGDGGEMALDFISKLPDVLLLDILSLLPASDLVKTSMLSKRWHGLWTYSPTLNFNCHHFGEVENFKGVKTFRRFLSFINCTLLLCQPSKLDKLKVLMYYMKAYAYDVDAWLLLALRKNVQELELNLLEATSQFHDDFDPDDDDGSLYVLPSFLLTSSSLVTLKVRSCTFEDHMPIKLKLLKVLSLNYMSLNNDFIRDIISGCPSLESLEISFCYHFNFIEAKTLPKLAVSYCYDISVDIIPEVRISAPHVRSLEIIGCLRMDQISLINSSASLVNANITFNLLNDDPYTERSREMFTRTVRGLLENVSRVKYLTIGSWCLQVLSLVKEKTLLFRFSNLVSLTLHTHLKQFERPGITRLLVLTPLLDTLVIENTAGFFYENVFKQKVSKDEDEGNYWASQKRLLEVTLQNLKIVKIIDFKGSEDEMEFIAFMLNNAKQLKKMIIQRRKLCSGAQRPFDVTSIAERLLSFPRCSSNAVTLFYEIPEKA